MDTLHLKIITPRKVVREEDVVSVTVPGQNGEITLLPKHVNLFSLLVEGILKIKTEKKEDFLAIGGGYLQTNGREVTILVSRAYGQNEIDEKLIKNAHDEASKILKSTKDEALRGEAIATMRRAIIDSKLLKKRKHTSL